MDDQNTSSVGIPIDPSLQSTPAQTVSSEQSPLPPPEYTNTTKKMPTLVGIVLLVILLLLLGGGTFLLTMKKTPENKSVVIENRPSPSPIPPSSTPTPATKDWPIYTDKDIIFSFQYPKNWEKEGTQLKPPLDPTCQPLKDCGGFPSLVNIYTYKNEEEIPLDTYIFQLEKEALLDEKTASKEAIMKNYTVNTFNKDASTSSLMNTRVPGGESVTKVYYQKGTHVVGLEFIAVDATIIKTMLTSFQMR